MEVMWLEKESCDKTEPRQEKNTNEVNFINEG